MFWGSFSYYKKGPCYIQELETAAEKRALKKDLEERNKKIKAEHRKLWKERVKAEANVYYKKYKKKKGGLKPKQVYNKKNRAII